MGESESQLEARQSWPRDATSSMALHPLAGGKHVRSILHESDGILDNSIAWLGHETGAAYASNIGLAVMQSSVSFRNTS